jgi:hypothetical protein
VNIGQPYACYPLGTLPFLMERERAGSDQIIDKDNADCRGAVEDPAREGNRKCANSGWALWQIPDGDYMFCCLPGWYGY